MSGFLQSGHFPHVWSNGQTHNLVTSTYAVAHYVMHKAGQRDENELHANLRVQVFRVYEKWRLGAGALRYMTGKSVPVPEHRVHCTTG